MKPKTQNEMLLLGITMLLLLISACSSVGNQTILTESADESLPVSVQLIVGSILLDETQHKITSEEAEELLPLWKAVQALSSNNATADEELEALYKQIQETMTEEQILAINEMVLGNENLTSIAEELGLSSSGAPNGLNSLTSDELAEIPAAPQNGEIPAGVAPGEGPPDGFAALGGTGLNSAGNEDTEASSRTAIIQVPTQFLEAFIEFLETKNNSQS